MATAVRASHQRIETGMPLHRGQTVRAPFHQADIGEPSEDTAAELPAEQRRQPVALGQLLDAGNLGAAGDEAGEAERDAAQDEQRCQRDDEGRQAGLHHQPAVDIADDHGGAECQQHAGPDRPAEHGRGDGDDDAGEGDHRAERQVELAADHQQRDRDGEDAELGRDFEEVDDAARAEQAAVAGEHQEEQQDQDATGGRAELRPAHGLAREADLAHAFVATLPLALLANRHQRWSLVRLGMIQQKNAGADPVEWPAPAPREPYRTPCLASSMTEPASALPTKPGPVG